MMTPGLAPPECSAATADGRDLAPAMEDESGTGDIVVKLTGDFGHCSTVRSCKIYPVIVLSLGSYQ